MQPALLVDSGHLEITADLVEEAGRLAEKLALRGHDAIQLAAATSLDFDDLVTVTADQRLTAAAQALGLASISDPAPSK